jgi:hypothetical protein
MTGEQSAAHQERLYRDYAIDTLERANLRWRIGREAADRVRSCGCARPLQQRAPAQLFCRFVVRPRRIGSGCHFVPSSMATLVGYNDCCAPIAIDRLRI